MKDLFDSYFNHPYFAYSILSKREIQNQFQKVLLTNINYLLKDENKKWYLETFSWFIDKKILLDIIKQYGSPFDMVQKLWLFWNGDKTKIALFEGLLYYQFIDKNNQKYNYTILDIEKEFSSFKNYLLTFWDNKIIYETNKTTNDLSDKISCDLKKRGMKFVGSTIIYSYLQAIGIIYSHEKECFKYIKIID